MDNFVDKVSQRINAQEMIRANAQAEANEMQRLQEQVAQYEAILHPLFPFLLFVHQALYNPLLV